MSVHYFTL